MDLDELFDDIIPSKSRQDFMADFDEKSVDIYEGLQYVRKVESPVKKASSNQAISQSESITDVPETTPETGNASPNTEGPDREIGPDMKRVLALEVENKNLKKAKDQMSKNMMSVLAAARNETNKLKANIADLEEQLRLECKQVKTPKADDFLDSLKEKLKELKAANETLKKEKASYREELKKANRKMSIEQKPDVKEPKQSTRTTKWEEEIQLLKEKFEKERELLKKEIEHGNKQIDLERKDCGLLKKQYLELKENNITLSKQVAQIPELETLSKHQKERVDLLKTSNIALEQERDNLQNKLEKLEKTHKKRVPVVVSVGTQCAKTPKLLSVKTQCGGLSKLLSVGIQCVKTAQLLTVGTQCAGSPNLLSVVTQSANNTNPLSVEKQCVVDPASLNHNRKISEAVPERLPLDLLSSETLPANQPCLQSPFKHGALPDRTIPFSSDSTQPFETQVAEEKSCSLSQPHADEPIRGESHQKPIHLALSNDNNSSSFQRLQKDLEITPKKARRTAQSRGKHLPFSYYKVGESQPPQSPPGSPNPCSSPSPPRSLSPHSSSSNNSYCSSASPPSPHVTDIVCTSNLIMLGEEDNTCTVFPSPAKPAHLPSEFYPPGERGKVRGSASHFRHIRGPSEIIRRVRTDSENSSRSGKWRKRRRSGSRSLNNSLTSETIGEMEDELSNIDFEEMKTREECEDLENNKNFKQLKTVIEHSQEVEMEVINEVDEDVCRSPGLEVEEECCNEDEVLVKNEARLLIKKMEEECQNVMKKTLQEFKESVIQKPGVNKKVLKMRIESFFEDVKNFEFKQNECDNNRKSASSDIEKQTSEVSEGKGVSESICLKKDKTENNSSKNTDNYPSPVQQSSQEISVNVSGIEVDVTNGIEYDNNNETLLINPINTQNSSTSIESKFEISTKSQHPSKISGSMNKSCETAKRKKSSSQKPLTGLPAQWQSPDRCVVSSSDFQLKTTKSTVETVVSPARSLEPDSTSDPMANSQLAENYFSKNNTEVKHPEKPHDPQISGKKLVSGKFNSKQKILATSDDSKEKILKLSDNHSVPEKDIANLVEKTAVLCNTDNLNNQSETNREQNDILSELEKDLSLSSDNESDNESLDESNFVNQINEKENLSGRKIQKNFSCNSLKNKKTFDKIFKSRELLADETMRDEDVKLSYKTSPNKPNASVFVLEDHLSKSKDRSPHLLEASKSQSLSIIQSVSTDEEKKPVSNLALIDEYSLSEFDLDLNKRNSPLKRTIKCSSNASGRLRHQDKGSDLNKKQSTSLHDLASCRRRNTKLDDKDWSNRKQRQILAKRRKTSEERRPPAFVSPKKDKRFDKTFRVGSAEEDYSHSESDSSFLQTLDSICDSKSNDIFQSNLCLENQSVSKSNKTKTLSKSNVKIVCSKSVSEIVKSKSKLLPNNFVEISSNINIETSEIVENVKLRSNKDKRCSLAGKKKIVQPDCSSNLKAPIANSVKNTDQEKGPIANSEICADQHQLQMDISTNNQDQLIEHSESCSRHLAVQVLKKLKLIKNLHSGLASSSNKLPNSGSNQKNKKTYKTDEKSLQGLNDIEASSMSPLVHVDISGLTPIPIDAEDDSENKASVEKTDREPMSQASFESKESQSHMSPDQFTPCFSDSDQDYSDVDEPTLTGRCVSAEVGETTLTGKYDSAKSLGKNVGVNGNVGKESETEEGEVSDDDDKSQLATEAVPNGKTRRDQESKASLQGNLLPENSRIPKIKTASPCKVKKIKICSPVKARVKNFKRRPLPDKPWERKSTLEKCYSDLEQREMKFDTRPSQSSKSTERRKRSPPRRDSRQSTHRGSRSPGRRSIGSNRSSHSRDSRSPFMDERLSPCRERSPHRKRMSPHKERLSPHRERMSPYRNRRRDRTPPRRARLSPCRERRTPSKDFRLRRTPKSKRWRNARQFSRSPAKGVRDLSELLSRRRSQPLQDRKRRRSASDDDQTGENYSRNDSGRRADSKRSREAENQKSELKDRETRTKEAKYQKSETSDEKTKTFEVCSIDGDRASKLIS